MARDPYQYFRVEARELIEQLAQGALALESAPVEPDLVPKLLRLAHTLKGAARVVRRAELAELAHALEERLLPLREPGSVASREQVRGLLSVTDRLSAGLRALDAPEPSPAAVVPAAAERATADDALRSVRVDVQDTDSLLRGAVEASSQMTVLRRELARSRHLSGSSRLLLELLTPRDDGLTAGQLRKARELCAALSAEADELSRALSSGLERVDGELGSLRDSAQRLRLVPAQSLFPALERAVFDAAQSLGKRVRFESSGGEVRLDAHVLSSLRDALLHLVRNAVVHGVEMPDERLAAKKPAHGTVSLQVTRRGNRVAFVCRDDGRGIDVEAVRRVSVERGFLASERAGALSAGEVLRVLLSPGVSTSANVTQLAGRGIGLDVVREAMLRLKGEVTIESELGVETSFALDAPISIASLSALIVDVAGSGYAIPLDSVRSTRRVRAEEIVRSNEGESLLHEGKVLPFVALSRVVRASAAPPPARAVWPAVLVTAGGRTAALGVDRVLGSNEVIVRALPPLVDVDAVVSGAALDAEGRPQLVLDAASLVFAAEDARGVALAAPTPARPPILVIDDSLTTRMLEQSILESAGYEVELAVHAEQALEKAQLKRYGLFVVDVEMPGMDGFEFVTKVRADPALCKTPAVLVTSRNAPEDKRRGERVGAQAYIVKGEFDQGRLLQVIRSLIG